MKNEIEKAIVNISKMINDNKGSTEIMQCTQAIQNLTQSLMVIEEYQAFRESRKN